MLEILLESRSRKALVVAAFVVTVVRILLRLANRKKTKTATKFPSLPPAGCNLQEFLERYRLADHQQAAQEKYGDIFTVPTPIPGLVPNQVWINDPSVVKYLTVTCNNQYRAPSKFSTRGEPFRKATQAVVGVGVTGLTGDEWRWRKMALLKSFHKSKMLADERGLLNKILQEGNALCQALGDAADKQEVVPVDLLTTKAAVGVVLYFLFGRDLEFDAEELREAASALMEVLGYSLFTPTFAFMKYVPGTKSYQMEQKKRHARQITDAAAAAEIQRLLDEYEGKIPVHPDRKPGSVLATLIADESRFRSGGVSSMIAEARVFVQAGFETTAHSLAFSMGMMAERPDLATEMATLGKKLLPQNLDTVTVEQLIDAMEEGSLVKNFFLEALRLYPLAPSLGGVCTDDIVIQTTIAATGDKKNDDNGTQIEFDLPKGTAVFFPNMLLQRQVENPDTIDPNRWNVPTKSQEPFLNTFQNGAHSCPGKPLSLLEGHVFLWMVAINFQFEFPDAIKKVEYEDNLLLRPKDGMPLRVKRRQ